MVLVGVGAAALSMLATGIALLPAVVAGVVVEEVSGVAAVVG